MTHQTPPLDERIASALTNLTTAAAVQDLIVEVETAIVTADQARAEAEERALDPAVLDPNASTTMRDAEFLSRRLNAALPRLKDQLAKCLEAEYLGKWYQRYEALKPERDGAGRGGC